MRSPDNALEVDQLTRVFDVSAPWLNRVIDRKPKRYLRAVQDVTFTVQKENASRSSANPVAASQQSQGW